MLNYKEDKSLRGHLENFIVLRFLQNNNRTCSLLEQAFTASLTQVFGTNCFETLRQVGLALENSQSKLMPSFLQMMQRVKTQTPKLEFGFILTDNPQKLKIPDLHLQTTAEMQYFQSLFQDFYLAHFQNKYKACHFSMTMGAVEMELAQNKKRVLLRVFPFEALVLRALGGKRGLTVRELYSVLKKGDKGEDEVLFFKGVAHMRDQGLLLIKVAGFGNVGAGQVARGAKVEFNRKFISRFQNGQGRTLLYSISRLETCQI